MALPGWLNKPKGGLKGLKGLFGVTDQPPPPPVATVPALTAGGRVIPGALGAAKKGVPVALLKEAPLSPRRLLIILETLILAWSCWTLGKSWYTMLGDWPRRGVIIHPYIEGFLSVADLAGSEKRLWVLKAQGLELATSEGDNSGLRDLSGKLPSRVVTAVRAAGRRTWIGTSRGLALYEQAGASEGRVPTGREGRAGRATTRTALDRAHITGLAIDADGRIWAGTTADGLFIGEGGKWKQIKDELPTPYVTALVSAGGREAWVGLFSGLVVRTDGARLVNLVPPQGTRPLPVRGLVNLGGTRVLARTDEALFVVSREEGWRRLVVRGLAKDAKVVRVVDAGGSRVLVLVEGGELLEVDTRTGASKPIDQGRGAEAVAVLDGRTYVGREGSVWRLGPLRPVPLTNWGRFFEPDHWFPPAADIPPDWKDARLRKTAPGFALGALLAGVGLFVRAFRWHVTAPVHEWRILPLRSLGGGLVLIAILLGLEWMGWISTTASQVVWIPATVLFGLWTFMHWRRIVRNEWAFRSDAFWLGTGLFLSGTAAWLWWIQGALFPGLAASGVAGLFYGRSLQGLRRRRWHGLKMGWGVLVFVAQTAAILPPLWFATWTWAKGAFNTVPMSRMVTGMSRIPERLSWSPDGLLTAFVVPSGSESVVRIVSGQEGQRSRDYSVPSPEVMPRFLPDSSGMVMCYRRGDDTVVELVDDSGKVRWRSRLPGRPAPGWQPFWAASLKSIHALTYGGGGTQVWRLDRANGDAVRAFVVAGYRLSWPWMSADGSRFYCAYAGAGRRGIAEVGTAGGKLVWIEPVLEKHEPMLVWAPSEEAKVAISFMEKTRDGARHGLARVHDGLESLAKYFGWRVKLPEFWIKLPKRAPRKVSPGFRWEDYDLVRDVTLSADQKNLACVARRATGEDQVLYVGANGYAVRVLYRARGTLSDLRWAPYKNRVMVVEQYTSRLAPFPMRKLVIIDGLPDAVSTRPVMPFVNWVSSPQFSPDGQRVACGAAERLWNFTLDEPGRYALYELRLESQIGLVAPPPMGQEREL